MILAAGRGERMGELTLHTPKPLLRVGKHSLIEHAIFNIKQAGITDIVINVSYLGERIQEALGDGHRYGVVLQYSFEPERLETAGGIIKALPLLGEHPFIVVSADVMTRFPLANLPTSPDGLAHLVMVDNPPYHPNGDFSLQNGWLSCDKQEALTFANIGVYRKELFEQYEPGYLKLAHVLKPAIDSKQVTGEKYNGFWANIGTPADIMQASSA